MESHEKKVVTIENKRKTIEARRSKTKNSTTKLFNHSDYLQQEKETLKRYLD